MWLGRFQLGQAVCVPVLSDGAALALGCAAPPALAIYDASGARVFAALLPPLDPNGTAGSLFALSVRLGGAFAVGQYRVSLNYTAGDDVGRLKTCGFQIVPGGDPTGNAVSMWFYPRPNANFLVLRTDADTRQILTNPYQ